MYITMKKLRRLLLPDRAKKTRISNLQVSKDTQSGLSFWTCVTLIVDKLFLRQVYYHLTSQSFSENLSKFLSWFNTVV